MTDKQTDDNIFQRPETQIENISQSSASRSTDLVPQTTILRDIDFEVVTKLL